MQIWVRRLSLLFGSGLVLFVFLWGANRFIVWWMLHDLFR